MPNVTFALKNTWATFNRNVAYVAGPYRAKTQEEVQHNVDNAREVVKWAWKKGFVVISPHLNHAGIVTGMLDEEAVIMPACLKLVGRCDLIIMVPGWQESQGSREEHGEAVKLKLGRLYPSWEVIRRQLQEGG